MSLLDGRGSWVHGRPPDAADQASAPRPACGSRTRPESFARFVNDQDVNCTPWSEWMIVPSLSRPSMAMPSALVTNAAVGELSIDQPTIFQEYTLSTAAQ